MINDSKKFESDTLEEAYFDRNQAAMLAAVLAAEHHYHVGWRDLDTDWPVLLIELPTGQVSWHIPKHERLLDFLGEGFEWDGHDLETKRQRIHDYIHGQITTLMGGKHGAENW